MPDVPAECTISFKANGTVAQSLFALYELLTIAAPAGMGNGALSFEAELPGCFRWWIETLRDSAMDETGHIALKIGWDDADRQFMQALDDADKAYFEKVNSKRG